MKYGYARVSTVGQAKDGNSLSAQEATLIENGAQFVFKDALRGQRGTDRSWINLWPR